MPIGAFLHLDYSPAVAAWVERLAVAPSERELNLYSALESGLKADGVWDDLDALQLYFVGTRLSGQALTDFRNPTRVATAVSSPGFDAKTGFTTNGSTSYIDTGYNPSTGPLYSQNSAFYAIHRADAAAATGSIGGFFNGSNGNSMLPLAGTITYRANQAAASNPTRTYTNGLYSANRSGANAHQVYVNGSLVSSGTVVSTPVVNNNIFVGRGSAASYQSGTYECFAAGRSLDATKQAALSNRISAFRTGVAAL